MERFQISTIQELARLKSTLRFTLINFTGLIITRSDLGLSILYLLTFTGFSTAFGFAINDISDTEIDKLVKKIRNPIVSGKISRKGSIILSLIFLFLSLLPLPFLSVYNQLVGLAYILILYTYSFVIRAKSKPIIDILYHATAMTLIAFMSYIQYKPIDIPCLLLTASVFFLSGMSEILQEVRDYESDKELIETTVIFLGKGKSLMLGLSFFLVTFFIFLLSPFFDIIPYELLLFSPLAYFIIKPLVKGIRNEKYHTKMIEDINKRSPLIVITLLVAFLFFENLTFL